MSRRALELVAMSLRAARRAGLVWSAALVVLVVVTVAFYPAFKGEADLTSLIESLPEGLVDAFGLNDFGSPAGFLRANLYAVLVPLLLAVAGILLMNGQTASDEDSGRMEAYLAQPVSRSAVFIGRVVAVVGWVVLIGAIILVAQLVSNAIFGLEIGADRIITTVILCLLLGLLHAGLAAAVAGWTGRPGLVLGIGLALVIAGYVVMALFPISDVLEPWRHISPWDWALGGDPLTNDTEAWRYLALGVPALVLIGLGTWAFTRRDVNAA